MIPNVLTIAGSDPSGGAGIQADLKTISALGGYGMAVITALTAQNTTGVSGVQPVSPEFVSQQLRDVFDDVRVDAVKIGMLGDEHIIRAVSEVVGYYKPKHVVLDPVMVATSGDSLLAAGAVSALKDVLAPMVDVITPNIPEAEKLMRKAVLDMSAAAEDLLCVGAKAVYLKGGHLKGDVALDVLAQKHDVKVFKAPRVDTENTHGTGCTLSSAIAVYLAKGHVLEEACLYAKNYLTEALRHADMLDVGIGSGPVNHNIRAM